MLLSLKYFAYSIQILSNAGGASGGSWMIGTTERGTGTIVSLNSWGYSEKTGIAGPSLRTASGSQAECLFRIAKIAGTPPDGGWTANC
jgi:hypothetical protein